jgi:hypothetical protein
MPLREAYKMVASTPDFVLTEDSITNIQQKTHLGAPDNLNFAMSSVQWSHYFRWINHEQTLYQNAIT